MAFSHLIDSDDRRQLVDKIGRHLGPTPDVGVGLLNYNGVSDTVSCLDSVVKSTSLPKIIVIIENGSLSSKKDRLYDQIGKRGEQRCKLEVNSETGPLGLTLYERNNETWILIVDNELNVGFCSGNNLAVECCKYLGIPYTLVLNNDAELKTGCLDTLHETISNHDEVVAVSPVIYDQDGELWYTGGKYSKWDYQYKRDFATDGTGYIGEISRDNPYWTNLYSGACVLFETETYYEEGGMYDPLFISIDEPEFSRHLRKQGHSIAVDPRGEATHQLNKTLGSAGSKYHDYFYVRNFLIYSYIHNNRRDHAAFFGRQFINYLRPFLQSDSGSRTNRAGTGVDAIIDYFRGQWGPGRWWEELNTLQSNHPIWKPTSQWNANRRK